MEIKLTKKPLRTKIIEGFPGFGMIGTIATEFLIEHLKAEKIGSFYYNELPATIAIHDGKLVDPMGVFYSKEHNLIILHTILSVTGMEWTIADNLNKLAKETNATEIISVEGISSPQSDDSEKVYFYTNNLANKDILKKRGLYPLKESIIVGVSGALMLRAEIPITCFFAETKSNIPDSRAASNIIKALDNYLNLKVDYRPLLRQAQQYEDKFMSMAKQSSAAMKIAEKKKLDYLG